MPGPWPEEQVVGLSRGRVDEREGLIARGWDLEDPRVCGQSKERRPRHKGNGERLIFFYYYV